MYYVCVMSLVRIGWCGNLFLLFWFFLCLFFFFLFLFVFFFFSSRRRHTRSLCDWSSDVCSDLLLSLCLHVCHAQTRDRSRLLGPCFKTGRKKPFSHRHGKPRYYSAQFESEQFRILRKQPRDYAAQIDSRKPISG